MPELLKVVQRRMGTEEAAQKREQEQEAKATEKRESSRSTLRQLRKNVESVISRMRCKELNWIIHQ